MKVFFVGVVLCGAAMVGGYFWWHHAPVCDVSKKYDWTVPSSLAQPKDQNEFDVIVVGSGIGGLSCAAMLAQAGYKLLVLEQHSQVGGYCSSYQRDGFTFNVAVEDVSGLWKHGMVTRLLQRLGLKQDELFVRNNRLMVLGDLKIRTSGVDGDFVKKLSKEFPQEAERLKAFFAEVEQVLSDDPQALQSWATTSFQQKLDQFFKDDRLKKFLSALVGYLGTAPDKTPAIAAAYACLQYFIYGGYLPKGGAQHFAETLKKVVEEHHGMVLTSCKVDQILTDGDRVIGVQAGNRRFNSQIVVANANAKTTFLNLVPQGALPEGFAKAIARLKMSMSMNVVHLGVDMGLKDLPSLINVLDQDHKCHILIVSNADASLAPEGKSSVSMLLKGQYDQVPPMGTPAYKAYRDAVLEQAIGKAEFVIPGLRQHIAVSSVETPRDFEKFTSMPEGAIYAFDQSIGKKRPSFKTPIKGLYLSSASNKGGGIESVVGAGMLCADDILKMHANGIL